MSFEIGDRIVHRDNPELGPGLVVGVGARRVSVLFPRRGAKLELAADSDALVPVRFQPGDHARLGEEDAPVVIAGLHEDGETAELTDGRSIPLQSLWPIEVEKTLEERLVRAELESTASFVLRLDAMRFAALREADGLGTFLGGRIQIFPHQLFVAERATQADPVRWLLADEVGLGKTVEACLILQKLLHTKRTDRVLVVAPSTLTVQWLGELWRKYHRVFVLIDDKRLLDVQLDYGEGFNPFDAYKRAVIARERLEEDPWLVRSAVEAGIDLLIVDEAHHMRRAEGHPGNPAYRAVQPLAEAAEHTLLLTASPLEDDAHGFFRLLQLLRPDEFPEEQPLLDRLDANEPLPPCTSSTRRADIGGLPPRKPRTVPLPEDANLRARLALEQAIQNEPATNALERKRKLQRLQRLGSSLSSWRARMSKKDEAALAACPNISGPDARLRWLAARAPGWKDAGEKTLIFVADREGLEEIRTGLSRHAQLGCAVFHEDLSPGQRDIEVARFRGETGHSILISTECGGEGRNFQFCTRLVLWDLPWDPAVVEQRIGRLDRIGRSEPTVIVVFRPPAGIGLGLVDTYERLGLFEHPLGGLTQELAGVTAAIERCVLDHGPGLEAEALSKEIEATEKARQAVDEAAQRELHQNRYRETDAEAILARVPVDLDDLAEEVVTGACAQLGLKAEQVRGEGRWALGWSGRAKVESLPGVAGGSSFLGTFSREAALEDESIDFFASGHPMVEGLMAWLEDSPNGRITLLRLKGDPAFGVAGFLRRDSDLIVAAIDVAGKRQTEWEERLGERPLRTRRLRRSEWKTPPGWEDLIRRGVTQVREVLGGEPEALAALWFEP